VATRLISKWARFPGMLVLIHYRRRIEYLVPTLSQRFRMAIDFRNDNTIVVFHNIMYLQNSPACSNNSPVTTQAGKEQSE
jgi:hypothetical protein